MTWGCVRHSELPWGPQVCHLRAPRLVLLPTARIPPHELIRSLQLLFENNSVAEPRVPDVEFEDQITLCADPRAEREVVFRKPDLLMGHLQAFSAPNNRLRCQHCHSVQVRSQCPPCGVGGYHKYGKKRSIHSTSCGGRFQKRACDRTAPKRFPRVLCG